MTGTPVGDWLHKRYPPNPGATHYLGSDGDPGCCAGPHPMCTYDAGFREGAAAERDRIRHLAQLRGAIYIKAPDAMTSGNAHVWLDPPPNLVPFADLLTEPTP